MSENEPQGLDRFRRNRRIFWSVVVVAFIGAIVFMAIMLQLLDNLVSPL